MAKKKEPKILPRILTKPIPSLILETDPSGVPAIKSASNGWRPIVGFGGQVLFVWEGYIDLTGMTVKQDLSMAVQTVEFQEGFAHICLATSLNVWDMVLDVPVDWDVALLLNDGTNLVMPGFSGSSRNPENVIQGSYRMFGPGLPNTITGISEGTMPLQSSQWGVNAATASDRLYITRIVTIGTGLDLQTAAATPPTLVAMPVIFFEEKDISHMERLRRSYILQGPFS